MNANVFAKDMLKSLGEMQKELRGNDDLLNRFYERLNRRFKEPKIDIKNVEIPEQNLDFIYTILSVLCSFFLVVSSIGLLMAIINKNYKDSFLSILYLLLFIPFGKFGGLGLICYPFFYVLKISNSLTDIFLESLTVQHQSMYVSLFAGTMYIAGLCMIGIMLKSFFRSETD